MMISHYAARTLPRRALSLRQPWAELVVSGEKSIEVRGRNTNVRGEVQIYAGLKRIDRDEEERIAQEYDLDVDALPRGVIVGTATIVDSRPVTGEDSAEACFTIRNEDEQFGWLLADARRLDEPYKPERQPQPSFFNTY